MWARLGIPDQYVAHGDRTELLAELGLDADGILVACRDRLAKAPLAEQRNRLRV